MRLMTGQLTGYAAGQMGHSVDMFTRTHTLWLDGAHNNVELDKFEQLTTSSTPTSQNIFLCVA